MIPNTEGNLFTSARVSLAEVTQQTTANTGMPVPKHYLYTPATLSKRCYNLSATQFYAEFIQHKDKKLRGKT